MKQFYPLCLVMLFFACQSTPSDESQNELPVTPDSLNSSADLTAEPAATFAVNIENLRIRDQAGPQGKEIGRLPVGQQVTATGAVSDLTTKIALRGVNYDEPWLAIRTADGLEGWVYLGGIQLNRETAMGKQLIDQRLDRFFKPGTARLVNLYQSKFASIEEVHQFAAAGEEGSYLIDSLINPILQDWVLLDNLGEAEAYPDMSWLEESLPGYVLEQVAEGTMYQFFQDFREWYPLAEKTPASTDNEWLDLMVQVYPMDSVAYYFPSWFLQTWDYGGNSLLGKGIHLQVFKGLNGLLGKTDHFQKELMIVKTSLIQDIIGYDEMGYEMPQKAILTELDQILSADLIVLNEQDRRTIEERRQQFKQPKVHEIRLNLRSGM